VIQTERLLLVPLTYEQLIKYIWLDSSLEPELNVIYHERKVPPELLGTFEKVVLPRVADPGRNYLYSTLWVLVLKSENVLIGDLCFKGDPDPYGEIEIGYGTYPEYQGKGYMTEAINGMMSWAANQKDLKTVVAETEKNNEASIRILEYNDFVKYDQVKNMFKWRKKL
jgi:ribosomal-protein-alanine N-acetyltransferase